MAGGSLGWRSTNFGTVEEGSRGEKAQGGSFSLCALGGGRMVRCGDWAEAKGEPTAGMLAIIW